MKGTPCVRERFSILNAILLPDKSQEGLSPEISPVNTFRVIFNKLFDADLEMLEDRSVFTVQWRPYDFEPVDPADLDVACPAP